MGGYQVKKGDWVVVVRPPRSAKWLVIVPEKETREYDAGNTRSVASDGNTTMHTSSVTHYVAHNPDTNDDEPNGFRRLDRWVNSTTGEVWLCVDPETGYAHWVQLGYRAENQGQMLLSLDGTHFQKVNMLTSPRSGILVNRRGYPMVRGVYG